MPAQSPAQNPESSASPAAGVGLAEPDRIRRFTFKHDLEQIDNRYRDSIRRHAESDRTAIGRRLAELDREWPVERVLMAGAGTFVWLGLGLGRTVNRRLLGVSAAAGAMLLVFAWIGWAPPVLVLRRLGIRTHGEIDRERIALKALRGDFGRLDEGQPDRETRLDRALKAAEPQAI